MSPEERIPRVNSSEEAGPSTPSPVISPSLRPNEPQSNLIYDPNAHEENAHFQAGIIEPTQRQFDARTRLLEDYHKSGSCGMKNCNHGTFSPRVPSIRSSESGSSSDAFRGQYAGGIGEGGRERDMTSGALGDTFANGLFSRSALNTKWLSKRGGISGSKIAYLSYYFPFTKWIGQYQWRWFQGDLIAALTMASFYIPMSLSLASNLGHIPPINGLYSFVFNPVIYAILGSCPQMVVGPEAAGSLLVGTVVRTCIDTGNSGDDDDVVNAQIAGVVTGIAGAIIFVAGLTRLGFLDSVLSRPFLRGFISAIGFVILVDQTIPELGLSGLASQVDGVSHGSSVVKLVFLFKNIGKSHGLTAAVSIVSFVIIMIFRSALTPPRPLSVTNRYIELSSESFNLDTHPSHIFQIVSS
jgi:hypothetical protein